MECKRVLLALLVSAFSQQCVSQDSLPRNAVPKDQHTVLFVCEHGAARSTIAAAYFNKHAKGRKLQYRAIFRGTDPESVLTPTTRKGLLEDGFQVNSLKPRLVSGKDIAEASRIITFDCVLPKSNNTVKPVEQWNGVPPPSKDYSAARDTIVAKVKRLVEELTKADPTKN